MSEPTVAITHHLTSQARPLEYQTAIVIPAFNEELSIGRVVKAIPRFAVSEIIVVNNGSSDSTVEVAREAGATVLSEPRKGYGYACLHGIAHAIELKADIIAFMDGDNSDYPDDLPDVLRPIQEAGYDMVVGSRMLGKREPGSLLPQAIIGNWVACFLIRLFWGYKFTDLGPLRAVRTDALRKMQMSDLTFGWTVEMQIKAAKLKLKCTEVSVRYRKRIGNSKVTGTLSGTLKASMKILYTILKHIFARA